MPPLLANAEQVATGSKWSQPQTFLRPCPHLRLRSVPVTAGSFAMY